MLCDNCGKREANVRYSENINGKVRELNLCEECSQKLGIGHMDFSMPMDFSNFFGDFMEKFAKPEWMPLLNEVKTLTCDNCGYTFDDIVNTGKLGCGNCYDVFEAKLDPIIKRIQGANQHVGRIGKIIDNKTDGLGGGIFVGVGNDVSQDVGSTLNIYKGEISGNTAGVAGGGIYVSKLSTFNNQNAIVQNNTPDNIYYSPTEN